MSSLDIEERRRTPRQRLGKLATIKLGIGLAPRYCLVSNLSSSKSELVPLDSWVACRIERAPLQGWPDAAPAHADNREVPADEVH